MEKETPNTRGSQFIGYDSPISKRSYKHQPTVFIETPLLKRKYQANNPFWTSKHLQSTKKQTCSLCRKGTNCIRRVCCKKCSLCALSHHEVLWLIDNSLWNLPSPRCFLILKNDDRRWHQSVSITSEWLYYPVLSLFWQGCSKHPQYKETLGKELYRCSMTQYNRSIPFVVTTYPLVI